MILLILDLHLRILLKMVFKKKKNLPESLQLKKITKEKNVKLTADLDIN